VASLVEWICGERPEQLRHMWFGMASTTFDAILSERSFIVRCNSNLGAFDATRANLEVLGGLGLPVPRILAAGAITDAGPPFAYMVLEKIPGRDLRFELASMTPAQQSEMAECVVAAQNLAERVPSMGGYGFTAIGLRGPLDSWRAVLDRDLARFLTADGWLVDRGRALSRRLDTEEAYLAAVSSLCFLDDLTTKNVIVDRGELQGFVDFDCVCFGDRLYQIGLTLTAITADLGIRDPFYVDELCRFTGLGSSGRELVGLYAALFAVDFLARGAGGSRGRDDLADLIARAVR